MRIALLLLASLVLTACGDSTGPGDDHVGTYQMISINGEPLPFELFGVEIQSASVTLRADGTYSSQTASRVEDLFTGEVTTETDTEVGTYRRTGNTILIRDPDGEEAPVTFSGGNTLTADAGLFVAVYRK